MQFALVLGPIQFLLCLRGGRRARTYFSDTHIYAHIFRRATFIAGTCEPTRKSGS